MHLPLPRCFLQHLSDRAVTLPWVTPAFHKSCAALNADTAICLFAAADFRCSMCSWDALHAWVRSGPHCRGFHRQDWRGTTFTTTSSVRSAWRRKEGVNPCDLARISHVGMASDVWSRSIKNVTYNSLLVLRNYLVGRLGGVILRGYVQLIVLDTSS